MTDNSKGNTQKKGDQPALVSPAELRTIFGQNLRYLCKDAQSITGLCLTLGINRTQFNRYLSGASFPRPDILHRICSYFDVDARIILEPIETIKPTSADLLNHPEISQFIGARYNLVPEAMLPTGIYSFSRKSFIDDAQFVRGIVRIYRKEGRTYLRGFEAKLALAQQGLNTSAANREFRGLVLAQEGGIAALVSRRGAMTCSFNFLAQVPSFENNFWLGYCVRTVRESALGTRTTRLAYEFLGNDFANILRAARASGYCTQEDLPAFHRTLLKPQEPFY